MASLPRFRALPPTSDRDPEPSLARSSTSRSGAPLSGGPMSCASFFGQVSFVCLPGYAVSDPWPVSSHCTSRLRNTGGPSHRAAILAAKSDVSGRLEFSIADS